MPRQERPDGRTIRDAKGNAEHKKTYLTILEHECRHHSLHGCNLVLELEVRSQLLLLLLLRQPEETPLADPNRGHVPTWVDGGSVRVQIRNDTDGQGSASGRMGGQCAGLRPRLTFSWALHSGAVYNCRSRCTHNFYSLRVLFGGGMCTHVKAAACAPERDHSNNNGHSAASLQKN